MRDLFIGYYRPTDEELKDAWKECIFVLDTNVLLNLYRYPEQAREDLVKIFTSLKERLWIPYHAALEYQRNRMAVIAEQKSRFREVRDSIDRVTNSLNSDFQKLQLRDRHSLIDPDKFIGEIQSVADKYKTDLDALEKQQLNVNETDRVRDVIDDLFGHCVGPAPSQAFVTGVVQDGAQRFLSKTPPGYMDESKKEGPSAAFSYGGVSYEARFGDLLLWKQIIEFSEAKPSSYIVFITDDEKEDWWHTVESQGTKKIGPRPELTEEICRVGKARGFHMYNSARFLAQAKEYLRAEISENSIDQVREVASRESSRNDMASVMAFHPDAGNIDEVWKEALRNIGSIVFSWVAKNHPTSNVSLNQGWPDILVDGPAGQIGFEVFVVTTAVSFARRIEREIETARAALASGAILRHEIVAVAASHRQVDLVSQYMKSDEFEIPDGITLTLAMVSRNENNSSLIPHLRISRLGDRKRIESLV